jgi:hypothetical protein
MKTQSIEKINYGYSIKVLVVNRRRGAARKLNPKKEKEEKDSNETKNKNFDKKSN